jgi:hypothetical protein
VELASSTHADAAAGCLISRNYPAVPAGCLRNTRHVIRFTRHARVRNDPWIVLAMQSYLVTVVVGDGVGFSIANDGSERRIAPIALEKFKMRVREYTRRTRGQSPEQIVALLRPYLIGSYFGFCQTPIVLTRLEAWIRRRLRMYLWRQWKTRQNRFQELRRRGVSKFQAAVAAASPTGFWSMSRHVTVQSALRNHVFDALGLPRLYIVR